MKCKSRLLNQRTGWSASPASSLMVSYTLAQSALLRNLMGRDTGLLILQKKLGNEDLQIYHTINKELSNAIENAVLTKANEVFNQEQI